MEYRVGISILIVVCTIAAMAIMLIKSKRWAAKQTINEETYVVCYRPVYRVIIAVGVLFFLLLTVAMLLLADMLIFLPFIIFFLTGGFCVSFWGIVVYEDKGILIYYHPPFRPVQIKISEIEKVQFLENRLNSFERYRIRICHHARRHLDISDMMQEFYRLAVYLSQNEAGMGAEEDIYRQYSCGSYRIERGCFQQGGVVIETSELSDNFSVAEKTSGKVATAAFALFWLTASVLFVFNWKEWSRGDPSYPLLFAAVTLVALAGVIRFVSKMLRKVSVCNHRIRVRNGIGRVSTYHIREISAVEEKGSFIILYAGGRRIVKMPQDDSFMAWLEMELSNVE